MPTKAELKTVEEERDRWYQNWSDLNGWANDVCGAIPPAIHGIYMALLFLRCEDPGPVRKSDAIEACELALTELRERIPPKPDYRGHPCLTP